MKKLKVKLSPRQKELLKNSDVTVAGKTLSIDCRDAVGLYESMGGFNQFDRHSFKMAFVKELDSLSATSAFSDFDSCRAQIEAI